MVFRLIKFLNTAFEFRGHVRRHTVLSAHRWRCGRVTSWRHEAFEYWSVCINCCLESPEVDSVDFIVSRKCISVTFQYHHKLRFNLLYSLGNGIGSSEVERCIERKRKPTRTRWSPKLLFYCHCHCNVTVIPW